MSTEIGLQAGGSSSPSGLRRPSRSAESIRSRSNSSSSGDGVHNFRDIIAASRSTLTATKLTAFKRVKTLGRRRKDKDKKPALEVDEITLPDQSVSAVPTLNKISTTAESTQAEYAITSEAPQLLPCIDAEGSSVTIGNCIDQQPVICETNHREDHEITSTMSPTAIARHIQSLISFLPPKFIPDALVSPRTPEPDPSTQSDLDAESKPEPERHHTLPDSKLHSLLTSTSVMNGSISKGRESVWALLDRLGQMPHAIRNHDELGHTNVTNTSSNNKDIEISSVMICCPLEPRDEADVEIARSEIVSIFDDDSDMEEKPERLVEPVEASNSAPQKRSVSKLWPFGKNDESSSSYSSRPRIKEVRVWYPSRTKVSLQAAWWGYRIYLPPPVMRVLSDQSLEAAKRAAMITAALTWLVSHIPTAMLPPQLGLVVQAIKGIVPAISYMGGFIAWSWNAIQSFDRGDGVILSATWLLPFALIPGTWFYVEIPPATDHIAPNSCNNNALTPNVTNDDSIRRPPTPPPKDSTTPNKPWKNPTIRPIVSKTSRSSHLSH